MKNNNYICYVPFVRNSIAYDHDFWYTLMISPDVMFSFSKFWLIFWVVRGVEGQKMVQNDKKFCLLHSISHEPYIIWLSFMLNMWKMIISLCLFFYFSKFWFFGLLGGKRAKSSQKLQKNSVRRASYLRNHRSYDCNLWYTCVKW